ncbi:MAG: hypothetical protein ACRCY8_16395 [Dermatophilaceae bacterium]
MPLVEIAHLSLLIVHFVGLAALIGPFLAQVRSRKAPRLRLMLVGALVQVVTGNALIASNRLQGLEVDEPKVAVKLAIAVVALGALAAAVLRRRRGDTAERSDRSLFRLAGGLGTANIAVAVVWS